VTIFVPPAVFEKEVAVLDVPVTAHVVQQLRGGDFGWVELVRK
jgi:hypothetical protein